MKDLGEQHRIRGDMPMLSIECDPDRTSSSLLREIRNPTNSTGWGRFFEIYAPLIKRFALKAGLNSFESEEVVQTTMVRVSENISEFEYKRKQGSFKGWLLNCVRWRISDVLRARRKEWFHLPIEAPPHLASAQFDPSEAGLGAFEKLWDDEWKAHQQRIALEKVRKKSSAAHFQIFCLYVLEGLPAGKVAQMVGVSTAQVYLVRCRLGRLLKHELTALR